MFHLLSGEVILAQHAQARGGSAAVAPAAAWNNSGSVRWWVGEAVVAMVAVV